MPIADCRLSILAWLLFAVAAAAQEPTAPTPAVSATPEESLAPSPATEQTPSGSPARSVRLSFVPPPMEGTISLGIFDGSGKLVRVLHREAKLSEFAIGADSLLTQWDGKNDEGEDLVAGKYHAHGYLVGPLKVEDLGPASTSGMENNATADVKVKLIPNPLQNDKRSIVDLSIGFDSDGSYLKTMDDLPLLTVSETPNLVRVSITKKSEKSIDISLDDGTVVRQFRVSGVDKMMAFDCGEFDLK
jgi:hypothetical protein